MNIPTLPLYEVANSLIPGVTALVYAGWLFGFEPSCVSLSNGLIFACMAYVVGQFLSRCGSLVIEPLARKLRMVEFSKEYYSEEKKDKKLPILLRKANEYRTLVAEGLALLFATIVAFLLAIIRMKRFLCLLALLFVGIMVFFAAYTKQMKAISNRIKKERR